MITSIIRHGAFETLYDIPLFINWPLTFMCNYNCSYCFGHTPFNKDKFLSWDKYSTAINNIAQLDRPMYDIILAGGEPTLHPEFFKIYNGLCLTLGDKLNRIKITTNGSRSIEFFKKLIPHAENIETVLNISLHTDHVKGTHIADLIKAYSTYFNFSLSLMYNPEKLNYALELFEMLLAMRKCYPFNLEVATLRQPPNFDAPDKRYTPRMMEVQQELMKRFEDQSSCSEIQYQSKLKFKPHEFTEILRDGKIEFINEGSRHLRFSQGLFKFKGMYCISGSHMLRIEPNGDIRGLVCPQATPVGNIYKSDFSKRTMKVESLQCKQENCGCLANDIVPKFLRKDESEKFVRCFKSHLFRIPALASKVPTPVFPSQNIHISPELKDIVELITILRPDVKEKICKYGYLDPIAICIWALKFGRDEVEIIRRLVPSIIFELSKVRAIDD